MENVVHQLQWKKYFTSSRLAAMEEVVDQLKWP